MNILHITPSSDGYEEVELVANQISRTNNLAAIEKDGVYTFNNPFERITNSQKSAKKSS